MRLNPRMSGSPLVWVAAGGVVAWVGYQIWKNQQQAAKAAAQPTAQNAVCAQLQAELTTAQAAGSALPPGVLQAIQYQMQQAGCTPAT